VPLLREVASNQPAAAKQSVFASYSGLWWLSLCQRRWLLFSICLFLTLVIASLLLPRWLRHGLDGIDVLAAGIYLLLMATGLFNLLLYVFGFFLLRAADKGVCPSAPSASLEQFCALGETHPTSTALGAESRLLWANPNAIITRTALVMPIYHENTERVYLGVRQTWLSAKNSGLDQHCDFYLLCDSTDPEVCEAEEVAYQRLLLNFDETRGRAGRIFLVRRAERKNFKAGNIAHFLEHHGTAYDFMLVLDADSVMLGGTIKRLIQRMQCNPNLAVLQTVINPIRSLTPFARAMQFSIARCIPLYACGMDWFWGRDSVYWGHNALIRIEPFMAYGNLPIMPGKPPLGGPIMSQDIVEAALLGRAGWAVEWDVLCGGSFDEIPANILTYARRDRRWCQGNFQHFWLIFGDRMRFAHRLYFANGIMAYLSGPLLLILLALGFVQGLRGRLYQYESVMFWSFMVLFLLMLTLPRILGLARVFSHPQQRAQTAIDAILARSKEIVSMILELVLSILISPALFYLHARFVLEILTGGTVQWKGQSRNPLERVSWSTAARTFWPATVLGVLWLALAVTLTPSFLVYLLPIMTGWILSIPLAVATSEPDLVTRLVSSGLFEERLSLDEIKELDALIQSNDHTPA